VRCLGQHALARLPQKQPQQLRESKNRASTNILVGREWNSTCKLASRLQFGYWALRRCQLHVVCQCREHSETHNSQSD
jgi:hypothetical protein